jgi:hypothetical protein
MLDYLMPFAPTKSMLMKPFTSLAIIDRTFTIGDYV